MKLDEVFMSNEGNDAISIILDSYLETAVWADAEEDVETDGLDFDKESITNARNDVREFYTKTKKITTNILFNRSPGDDDNFWRMFGHDFWLTRNEHGAGFWDKPELYGDDGDRLSDIATSMGGKDLYVGDDGKLHIS